MCFEFVDLRLRAALAWPGLADRVNLARVRRARRMRICNEIHAAAKEHLAPAFIPSANPNI